MNKQKNFQSQFSPGDKVITEVDSVGYVTQIDEYVWVLTNLGRAEGYREEGITIIEKATKNEFPLSHKQIEYLKYLDRIAPIGWEKELPQYLSAIDIKDIVSKGHYTNQQRFVMMWLDVNYGKFNRKYQNFLDFNLEISK